MLIKNKFRLSVSIDEIREFDREFWLGLLNQPADYLPACERALRDTVLAIYDPQDPSFHMIVMTLTSNTIYHSREHLGTFATPRSIDSSYLSKMVSIEGIVTRASLVRPKVIRSVHYAEKLVDFMHVNTETKQHPLMQLLLRPYIQLKIWKVIN